MTAKLEIFSLVSCIRVYFKNIQKRSQLHAMEEQNKAMVEKQIEVNEYMLKVESICNKII